MEDITISTQFIGKPKEIGSFVPQTRASTAKTPTNTPENPAPGVLTAPEPWSAVFEGAGRETPLLVEITAVTWSTVPG